MSVLTEALIKEGLIAQEQLNDAKMKQIGAKIPIQDLLVEMGFIKEEDLTGIYAKVLKMPIVDLSKEAIEPSATKLLTYELAKRHGVFPVRKEEDTLILAMSDPQDIIALDDIKIATNLRIKPLLCRQREIDQSIEKYYQSDDKLYDILKNVKEEANVELIKAAASGKEGVDTYTFAAEAVPIVKIVNLILSDAVKARGSDIHIEPQENSIKVRYRIDGDLKNVMDLPIGLCSSLVARIKILANLDIAENRKPQDGRIKILVNGSKIDLRISSIPMFYGEKIEIRILDPKETKIKLAEIGFGERELNVLEGAVKLPQGMILLTGPTGSGKTTTLYAALNFIKSETKNIMTIEDPIEYLIDGLNQMQLNPAKDVTFASSLRSILRQDPNVIFVGEIRDRETADIAFRASMTGHLVFSTLHTNSAVASIPRLLDIGLEPYLIASSLMLVLAQRLVKVICPDCKEEYTPEESLLNKFRMYINELNIAKFYHGKGCPKCDFSGYFGRVAIFEMLQVNEAIRTLITQKAPEERILNEAKSSGLRFLIQAGMDKVSLGITTLEEISRVIGEVEEEKAGPVSMETGKNIKILVVEDEEDILQVLVKRLELAGYDVVKARDGTEAVECAHKEKPDLVITDVTMPKMNGFELTKALRSRLETAAIPIIMLTGRQDKESELKGIDAGADDYLTKPFDAEKLLARIKMLLRRR